MSGDNEESSSENDEGSDGIGIVDVYSSEDAKADSSDEFDKSHLRKRRKSISSDFQDEKAEKKFCSECSGFPWD